MSCSIHPLRETAKECWDCYNSWPKEEKKRYKRAQCKRRNWSGKVDASRVNMVDGYFRFKGEYGREESEEESILDDRNVNVRSDIGDVTKTERRRNRPQSKYIRRSNTRKRPLRSA